MCVCGCRRGGCPAPTITADALDTLGRYSFPGNFLELAHALTHAVVLAHGGDIEAQHLPAAIRSAESEAPREVAAMFDKDNIQPLDSVAKQFEREYLIRVLRSVGGSRVRAAEILGLSRKGLWGKLKSHGISDDDIEDMDATGVVVEGPWKGRKA